MADERLRRLRRRFDESGSVEDAVAWLRELRRRDALPTHALRVAACVGHPAAEEVLLAEGDRTRGSLVFGRAFSRYGVEGNARFAAAYARARQRIDTQLAAVFGAAVEALEAWIVHPRGPCPVALVRRAADPFLRSVLAPVIGGLESIESYGGEVRPPRFVVLEGASTVRWVVMPLWAADVIGGPAWESRPDRHAGALFVCARGPTGRWGIWPRADVSVNDEPLTQGQVLVHGDLVRVGADVLLFDCEAASAQGHGLPASERSRLYREVADWALGIDDPVRRRVGDEPRD